MVSTHTTNIEHAAFVETVGEEDETEKRMYVLDRLDSGKWAREEAVVDSGAVECASSRRGLPHLRVAETPESRLMRHIKMGEIMSLRKDGGMLILDMWIWVPLRRSRSESCSGLHGRGKFSV